MLNINVFGTSLLGIRISLTSNQRSAYSVGVRVRVSYNLERGKEVKRCTLRQSKRAGQTINQRPYIRETMHSALNL